MRQLLLVASITVVGFVAGSAAGIYYERHSPLPPAPGKLGGELVGHRTPPFSGDHPINRAKLIARIKAVEPQIEAYKAKVDVIDTEFEKGLDAILTPEQRELHAEAHRHRQERGQHNDASSLLTDDQISRRMAWSADQILRTIVIDLRLQDLTKEVKLDGAQQDQVRGLLHHRRDEMIDLVDSTPPPSIQLVNLAPIIQRLAPAKSGTASLGP